MAGKKLILGCGKHYVKTPFEIGVDIRNFPGVSAVWDLNKTPWPFDARAFIHVSAIHLVEHLDSLISFMDECWRVLVPGGSIYLETPLAGGDIDLEWADPTHKRCYRVHTFVNYFSPEGVDKFGYTEKAWNFHTIKSINNIIKVGAYPIKL